MGGMATIFGPPGMGLLIVWLLVLLCSYTIVCCMGVVLLTIVYPCLVKKNYTRRWRRPSAYCYCRYVPVFGRGLLQGVTFARPAVLVSALYLCQFYLDYLGPVGSLTIVSLQYYLPDVLLLMASLGTISLRACKYIFAAVYALSLIHI